MRIPLGGSKAIILAGTAASYLGAIAISKVIASGFGPIGVGLAGSLMGLAALAASVALAGQTNALPRWIATQRDIPSRHLLRVSFLAALLMLVPTLLIVVPAGSFVLRDQLPMWITAAGLCVFTFSNMILLQRPTFISAVDSPKSVVRYKVTTATGTTLVTIALVVTLPLQWLPLSLGLGALVGAAAGSFQVRRTCQGSVRERLPVNEARALLQSTKGAFVGTASDAVVMGMIPTLVVVTIGAYDAGLFRAAWSVAALVWAFSFSVIRFSYLPQLSKVSTKDEPSLSTGRENLPHIMLAASLGAAVISWTGPFILPLLYSSGFEDAALVLSMLAVGTVARIWTSISGIALIAHDRQRQYSTTQLTAVTALLVATAAGGLTGNLVVLGAAVMVAMLSGGITAEWFMRRTLPAEDWPWRVLRIRERLALFSLLLITAVPVFLW